MIPSDILQSPPFRRRDAESAASAATAIVRCFDYFFALPSPLSTAFAAAMNDAGIQADDPLHRAGKAIARDIDAGIGVQSTNSYHNSKHFCEVLLGTIFVSSLAALESRERGLVYLAALMHDFHHDGLPNGTPFRLEILAIQKALPYLEQAGMSLNELEQIAALVLATEADAGLPFARHCYAGFFDQPIDAMSKKLPDELILLQHDPRLALQAMVLTEADILPSVGLTPEYAEAVSNRLEAEWQQAMSADDKIEFMDNVVGELRVSVFLMPNVREVRRYFAGKMQ